ncbi:Sec-independent protein translocase subunit TatA [Microbacterium sp. NPDC089320]|uniref:Sec-independent protein translocase subunit TatA n=1 Tax=Microbacterium TaxID=33882 RepID=UPI00069E0D0A|nr:MULTISPECIES: Sec-independent protein translocase subunit TatA [unclassified Microbacterium]AKV85550.1 preprotein translocase subunit TatA [Microbacterium sp. CGR1]APH44967.1 Sec-independent protein translocase TatA [Microbacterium sp. 1.5R]KRD52137.1 preprotein translocase subunit TatA [Microbacterium sp. Root280D1]MBC6494637.1 preprotein translocase subunit TatA [Microbacterium sp. 4-7]MDY0982774.1 Sec-independent protein translocase subunit TatA [Microbacterium sp. CFBP9023]
MGAFGWPHLLIILAVILLLFGAAKLPALAKSLGQSARVFKGEMKAMKNEDATDAADPASPTTTTSVADTTVTARDTDPGQPPRSA